MNAYSKPEADNLLQKKADASSVYTKSETYTKDETNTLLQKKADQDRVVNPNLLDNWYFGNPVNQRGQTSYSANGYTIDRWRTDHNISYGTLTVDKTAGCVTLSHADDGGFVDFVQYLENPPTEIVTFSVLMLSGNLYSATGTLGNISLNADEIYIRSGELNSVILRCKTGKTISMIAAKLELGSQQTLAHQENGVWVLNEIPDYGEQLARCQRYCRVYKAGTTLPYLAYPQMDGGWYASAGLPINGMRAIPTNNLGDGKEVAIVDLDGADATHDDMSMLNWGQTGNMLFLRISGGSHGALTSKFPYYVKLKSDLILSADL